MDLMCDVPTLFFLPGGEKRGVFPFQVTKKPLVPELLMSCSPGNPVFQGHPAVSLWRGTEPLGLGTVPGHSAALWQLRWALPRRGAALGCQPGSQCSLCPFVPSQSHRSSATCWAWTSWSSPAPSSPPASKWAGTTSRKPRPKSRWALKGALKTKWSCLVLISS